MIVNMLSTATPAEIKHIIDRDKESGLEAHVIQGEERTITAGQVRLKAALVEQRPEVGDHIKVKFTQNEKRPARADDLRCHRNGTELIVATIRHWGDPPIMHPQGCYDLHAPASSKSVLLLIQILN